MTKLNHNRPLLRYLDNLRREMAIDARRTDSLSFGDSSSPVLKADGGIFPLTVAESTAVSKFFDAIEYHINVQDVAIKALVKGASKRANIAAKEVNIEVADARLASGAKMFAAQMMLSGLSGRMNLVNVYRMMESVLKNESGLLWEVINEYAMRNAMIEIESIVDSHIIKNSRRA